MDCNRSTDSASINNLKCTICQNYLSYFPIYLTTENQNVCGRCTIPEGSVSVRNEVYELITAELRFPCRYSNEGCIEKLNPADISVHEKKCQLRLVKCPASEFNQCNDNIPLPNLKQHCEDVHADVLLTDGEFEIDLSTSEERRHILIHNHEFYTFKRSFESKSNKFTYIVNPFESGRTSPTMYEMCLSTDLRSLNINSFANNEKSLNESEEAYLDTLKTKNCTSVHGKIILSPHNDVESTNSPLSKKLLTVLKCANCSKNMVPPIEVYISENHLYCTSCGPFYYNFIALTWIDKVAEELEYPCENHDSGCNFLSKPPLLKKHQSFCQYANTKCPLDHHEGCEWNGYVKDVIPHITQSHSKNIAASPEILEGLTWSDHDFQRCYVIKYGTYFFRLIFSAQRHCYFWVVQMVGEYKDLFLFEVEISNEEKTKKLVTLQPVLPVKPVNELFTDCKEYCHHSLDQIQNISSINESIKYKIRILQK